MSNAKITMKKQDWFDMPTSYNPTMIIAIYEETLNGGVALIDEATGHEYKLSDEDIIRARLIVADTKTELEKLKLKHGL